MSDVINIKWKPVPYDIFEDYYEVSNLGLVRSKITGQIIKKTLRSGYISVNLCATVDEQQYKKSVKVHKMVALAFIKNKDPENQTWVNHINGDKFDCSAINLEWITPSGNAQHAADNNLVSKTKRAVIQYDLKTKKEIAQYESILAASKALNISDALICTVCSGEKSNAGGYGWKYIEENPNKTTDIDLSKFKQIVGFPNYLLNEDGRIYSLAYKKFLKYQIHPDGGEYVQLTNAGKQKDFFVHRLVALHFVKRKDQENNHVSHIDGNKTNNSANNLKWCYLGGVSMSDDMPPDVCYKTPYYNPKNAIKPDKRKSVKSGPKDLLTAKPKNLSKKQREERKKLLEKQNSKKSGSKTSKKVSKNKSKKINSDDIVEI